MAELPQIQREEMSFENRGMCSLQILLKVGDKQL